MASNYDCCFHYGILDIDMNDSTKLRILTNWEMSNNLINACNIVIVTSNTAWQGSIEGRILKEKSQLLNLDYEDYCSSLKHALFSSLGPKNDVVSFQEGVLRWQKIQEVGSLTLFGAFNLDLIEGSESWAETIGSLLDSRHTLNKEIDNLADFYSEIQWDGDSGTQMELKMEEITKTKNEIEQQLSAEFFSVLNEK